MSRRPRCRKDMGGIRTYVLSAEYFEKIFFLKVADNLLLLLKRGCQGRKRKYQFSL